MVDVFVSIGSNLNREFHLRKATSLLRRRFSKLKLSSVYESEAVGFTGAPFLNLVAGFATDQTIESVVGALKAIEDECGRVRNGRKFCDRTLDLDLLLYGDEIHSSGAIEVPRGELTRQAFILGPLAEIAGERAHPVLGVNYAALWRRFDTGSQTIVPCKVAGLDGSSE